MNASGDLRPSVYTGLNAFAENKTESEFQPALWMFEVDQVWSSKGFILAYAYWEYLIFWKFWIFVRFLNLMDVWMFVMCAVGSYGRLQGSRA